MLHVSVHQTLRLTGGTMTEADWLRGKDPEGMLVRIGDRLSARQWHLLACVMTRRVWDMLPDGPLRAAIEWCEHNPGTTHTHADLPKWVDNRESATEAAQEIARHVQREIVRTADPDADPESFQHTDDRKTHPAAPLFQAACRYAGNSVEGAAEAVMNASAVVAALIQLPPGLEQLAVVRRQVIEASRIRAASSLHASSALKLKAAGDEAADQDNRRNTNLRYATALQIVTKEDESGAIRHGDLEEQKQNSDRKAVVRFLHDMVGNPFKPYRFEANWRTSTVVGLAQAIYAQRDFQNMPILADALLDADCDEEAVLRHCRGTEAHTPDGPAHTRGCWVIDLILEHEAAFFAAPLLMDPPPKPVAPPPKPKSGAAGWDRLFQALQDADDDKE